MIIRGPGYMTLEVIRLIMPFFPTARNTTMYIKFGSDETMKCYWYVLIRARYCTGWRMN